jgi:hypothetical protein
VLDGVRVVQTGLLKESLEVVCWRSRLALDSVPGDHDALLVGHIHFFVIVVTVAGRGCNPLRMPLSPLLAALGVLLCAFDGDGGLHRLAIARDRFPAAWDRERLDRILVSGILGGDVK